jgi:hypothetical protein
MNRQYRRALPAVLGTALSSAVRTASPSFFRFRVACLLALLPCAGAIAAAQTISAQQLVKDVVYNEIQANLHNHSHWIYLDHDKTPDKDVVKLVVETAQGTVSKTLLSNGRPLTPDEEQKDRVKMESVINDPDVRAKQRKDSEHDSKEAIKLMRLLPDAFVWRIADESHGEATLDFRPNPHFDPPSYASRVFAAMAGSMVVDTSQKRLKDLRGTLIQPVEFAWGLFGKIQKGGTFRIMRTEVAPEDWEITQTHVHITGHMLFFKSIGQQEDEITSHYMRSPEGLTPRDAMQMLNDGSLIQKLGIDVEKLGTESEN